MSSPIDDTLHDNSHGSASVFEALALPWLPSVARFAFSLTRDRVDADDLVQETYLRAFHGWSTFAEGSDARRWLFTICRNAFVRSHRKKTPLTLSDAGDADALPAVLMHAAAVSDGLGDFFDAIDVRPAIDGAIEALPEPHRSVLLLVDVEGQSYEETAAILGVPVGTVRSRLFRARRAVQHDLIEYARDAGIGVARR